MRSLAALLLAVANIGEGGTAVARAASRQPPPHSPPPPPSSPPPPPPPSPPPLSPLSPLAASCAPELPGDISGVSRRFTAAGEVTPSFNDTLWWSTSLQRSRLDIRNRDGSTVSTVTDPGGSGLGLSSQTAANGSCRCDCFPFTARLVPHSFLGPGLINCTRQLPDAALPGRRNGAGVRRIGGGGPPAVLARRWLVYAAQPGVVQIEYFAAERAPWPLRIEVAGFGTQEFDDCGAADTSGGSGCGWPPALSAFKAPGCGQKSPPRGAKACVARNMIEAGVYSRK